ncbi:hypothetical protein [Bifidobacterium mellis]|uniref:hypothetical protein n=1 Tax=Bifidobacterium mellis TaxID=1293823 RepID=UPI0005F8ADF3|nr:hypothetical protein [Bifidobacterium mellis]
MAFPEEEQLGVDLLMVGSTNAEVPGFEVIADGSEVDKTGILTVSKWAEGAKFLAVSSSKRMSIPCC